MNEFRLTKKDKERMAKDLSIQEINDCYNLQKTGIVFNDGKPNSVVLEV